MLQATHTADAFLPSVENKVHPDGMHTLTFVLSMRQLIINSTTARQANKAMARRMSAD